MDGGGLRGLVETQVLKVIEGEIKDYLLTNQEVISMVSTEYRFVTKNDFHIDLADYFDAMAGISAGSWGVSYLSSRGGNGVSKDILNMNHIQRRYGYLRPGSVGALEVYFMEYGAFIYPPQLFPLSVVPRLFGLPKVKMDALNRPQYSPDGLEWVLDKFLGDTMYSQLSTSMMIAAFDLNIRAAVQFTYDELQPLPGRIALRNLTAKSFQLEKCIRNLKDLKADKNETDKEERLSKITTNCEKYKPGEDTSSKVANTSTLAPAVIPARKGVVRTGYVWTRTIPRDTSEDTDYKDAGVKYFEQMDYFVKDVTRASSAFPMIHPAKNIKPFFDIRHEYDLVDGALVGNNPTLQALIFMSGKPNIALSDIATISIGTGRAISNLEETGSGGYLQWAAQIVSLILDNSPAIIQSNLDYLFYGVLHAQMEPNQYLRVQYAVEPDTAEARTLASGGFDPTLLPQLRQIGMETGANYKSNIADYVARFIFSRCTDKRYTVGELARHKVAYQQLLGKWNEYETAKSDAGKPPEPSSSAPAPAPEPSKVNIL